MGSLPPEDDELRSLVGSSIPSEHTPEVAFRIERVLAYGGSAFTFFALRTEAVRFAPVVVKVIRPSRLPSEGDLFIQKEAVALGRLNDAVPPTPYVVRIIDTGNVAVAKTTVPWLALEYVHGGYEGTTLRERVAYSVRTVGCAFDAARASFALYCIGEGLRAIADVGVVHRDLTPRNVLCCGYGDTELFKIADFGLARASGMSATFQGSAVGTPGYAAPEQCLGDQDAVGPPSDVFSLGCVAYYLLTKEHYFEARNHAQLLALLEQPSRKSIRDSPHLAPEIASRPEVCAEIDRTIAGATLRAPGMRPQTAAEFVEPMRSALRRCLGEHRDAPVSVAPTTPLPGATSYRWYLRSPEALPSPIHRMAWDSDGRALVATDRALAFWNGTQWLPTARLALPGRRVARLVRRLSAGRFLVGDGDGLLAELGIRGIEHIVQCPDEGAKLVDACGPTSETCVAVGTGSDGSSRVWTVVRGSWSDGLVLPDAQSVTALAQWSPTRYLVAGRDMQEHGFLATVDVVARTVEATNVAAPGALLAIASQPDARRALITGRMGRVVGIVHANIHQDTVEGEPPLSACALDRFGRAWVASAGAIWMKALEPGGEWQLVWSDPNWDVPFVGVHAEDGRIVAMTATGAVLEGQAP